MNFEALKQQLIKHEGLRLKTYKDTVGKVTIGVGRNLTDNGISEPEAMVLLANDIVAAVADAAKEIWWPMVADNDARSRAMIDMVFNMGITRLRGFTNAIEALMDGDFEGAANEFMDSMWARQVGQRAVDVTMMLRQG